MKKILLASVATIGFSIMPIVANATPLPPGTEVVGDGGDAMAFYIGSSAYDLDNVEIALSGAPFFVNHSTLIGTSHDLGVYAAGVEIPLEMMNLTTGHNYFTGPGSRNPDGVVHADVVSDPTLIPGWTDLSAASQAYGISIEASDTVFVGFEDLINAGDADYNDLVFAVKAGSPGLVNEPNTLALLGSALLIIGMWFRRNKAIN